MHHAPDPTGPGRRQFLRTGGLAALAGTGVLAATRPSPASAAEPVAATDCVSTRDLGAGAVDFPVIGGALVGGTALAGSRNLTPAQVAVFDVATSTVTREVTIPVGSNLFVQAIAAAGESVAYIGTLGARNRTNVYRYDVDADTLAGVAALNLNIRGITVAPDGVVFAVGEPSRVYAFDPATGQVTELPQPDVAAQTTYSVAATETTAFVGSGNFTSGNSTPRLTAIDRATGQMQSILPPELSDATIVFSMRIAGGKLLVGTYAALQAGFAVIDLDDYSNYQVVTLPGLKIVDAIEAIGDIAYFTTRYSGNLWRYDLTTGELAETVGPQAGFPHWSLSRLDERLVGITVNSVWTLDPATGDSEVVNLVNAGATGQPQQMQSIAARAGKVMVAANWNIGLRDVASGGLSSFNVPGEAKDMMFVGDTLYLAIYTIAEIWTYDLRTSTAALAAKLPPGQNRPAAIAYDPAFDVVLVATGSDFTGGGALAVLDRCTGNLSTYENPLGPGQRVDAVAALDGTAVIAGSGGTVAGLDARNGRERWRLDTFLADHVPAGGLAAHRGSIYGVTGSGLVFAMSAAHGTIRRQTASQDLGGATRLWATGRGGLYGATSSRLFVVDPLTCEATVLVEGLGSQGFNGPDVTIDERDAVYVMKGFDALRVTVPRHH